MENLLPHDTHSDYNLTTLPLIPSSLSTSSYLPHYSVHRIFTYLKKNEIEICKRVSKLWNSVGRDYVFAWKDIFVFPFNFGDSADLFVCEQILGIILSIINNYNGF